MSIFTLTTGLARLKASVLPSIQAHLSPQAIEQAFDGHSKRKRIYHPAAIFLTFLHQVLQKASCRNAIVSAILEALVPADTCPHNAAYCNARARLPEAPFEPLVRGVAQALVAAAPPLWCGRHVKVVDGSSCHLADTKANQKAYPQSRLQPRGCGYPLLYFTLVLSLDSGAILEAALGNQYEQERNQFLKLWSSFDAGDVIVADKGFDSYVNMAALKQRSIDMITSPKGRYFPPDQAQRLAPDDWLIQLPRPDQTGLAFDLATLPKQLTVRLIRCVVKRPGFRNQIHWVLTTLLDADRYPAAAIAALYRRRWEMELYLRDIKQTLGMAELRGRTPAVCRKELWMHLLIYNLVRAIMFDAATTAGIRVQTVSFKVAWWSLRQLGWEVVRVRTGRISYEEVLGMIAGVPLVKRENRIEPRVVKRRKRKYSELHRPRKLVRMELKQALKNNYKPKRSPFEKPPRRAPTLKKQLA